MMVRIDPRNTISFFFFPDNERYGRLFGRVPSGIAINIEQIENADNSSEGMLSPFVKKFWISSLLDALLQGNTSCGT